MVKLLLRFLPYSLFLRLYYHYFSLQKRKFLRELTKDSKYKNLATVNLSDYKKSEKLFIIGSGYSLNNITAEQWNHINQHDVFGFNLSFLNKDHHPTFYTTEAVVPNNLNENGRSPMGELYLNMYRSTKEKYKSVLKFLTDFESRRIEHFENYGRDLFSDSFYIANTIGSLTNEKENFKKVIEYYKKENLFAKKTHIDLLFKTRGTVSMIISFAVNLGYKEIILCGIDLNDPRYFFEDKGKYPDLPKFFFVQKNKTHVSLKKDPLFLEMDKIIDVLNELVCKDQGIKLFVQNPKSTLAKFLPIYEMNKISKH